MHGQENYDVRTDIFGFPLDKRAHIMQTIEEYANKKGIEFYTIEEKDY